MNRARTYVLAALVFCACAPPSPRPPLSSRVVPTGEPPAIARGPRLALPNIAQTALANGLTVFAVSRPGTQLARVILADRAATVEGELQVGLAALTEAALEYDYDSPADPSHRGPGLLGPVFTSEVHERGTVLSLTVRPEDVRESCVELGRFVSHGPPVKETIDEGRAWLQSGLEGEREQRFSRLERLAARELFGPTSPFAVLPSGTKEQLAAITEDEVARFYAGRYQPAESALVIVGPGSTTDDLAFAKESFDSWQPQTRLDISSRPQWAPVASAARTTIIGLAAERQGATLTAATLPGPASASPDQLTCQLTAALLGRASDSALVTHQRRATDGGYYVDARCQSSRVGGMLELELDTDPARLEATLTELRAALTRAHTLPSADQMETARALVLGDVAKYTATNFGLAGFLAEEFCSGLPLSDLATLEARVDATTPADLARFAQHYLKPENLVVAVAGTRPEIEGALANFGKTRWQDE